MPSPAKRKPTVCAEPSVTSSRSLLVRLTLVEPTFCSASSLLAATRTSTRDRTGVSSERHQTMEQDSEEQEP